MKYAKLEDGVLRFAPKVLRVDGKTLINPTSEVLKAHGYMPIAEDIMPMAMEGYEVQAVGYAVEDGQIVRKWVQVEKPIPTQEEISQLRQQAYESEADRYLIAMHGYEVEGNTAAAENCKRAYLAKKREIRARISGSTVEPVQNVTETPASEPELVQIPLSRDDDLL